MTLKRSIGIKGMLFASVSAILGSGWLFSAAYTAQAAGPASMVSWLLGGLFILIVAFCYAEICTVIPVTGSSARIPHYCHGTFVSFCFAWLNWISYLSLMAIEVQGCIQYSSFYFPSLMHGHMLTAQGYVLATGLMLLLSFINTYSLRWLIGCNNLLTLLKLVIPIGLSIIILVLYGSFHHIAHPGNSQFAPQGWHGILGAITAGGIMFSFNGFKQAAEMAGEAKNPSKSIPLAIIGSILICLVVFLVLQMAFLSSITSHNIGLGWHQLVLQNTNSPLSSILEQDHLSLLIPVIYIGAIISPLAAALMYCASASRSLYGLSKNDQVPAIFQWLTPKGNPLPAIIANFVFGMMLFAPLPGWEEMMKFLSSILALTYAIGPVNLLALRKQLPDAPRPIRLPFVTLWSFAGLYICTLLSLWSGWDTIWKMIITVFIGYLIFVLYRILRPGVISFQLHFKQGLWLVIYFIGLALVSWQSNYAGTGNLSTGMSCLLLALLCILCLSIAMRWKMEAKTTQSMIAAHERPQAT